MTHKVKKNIKLLNNCKGLIFIIYTSLISADSLTSTIACDKAIEIFNDFLEALPYTKLEHKEYWKEKFEQGIEIAKINKSNFINESV